MARNENIASVLAFEKKIVPSDGRLYGTTWEEREKKAIPLKLIEKSVRGTISNRFKKKDVSDFERDPAKLNAKVESPNLQTVDACFLADDQDTLNVRFTLKVLSNVEQPSACNNAEFQKTYTEAAKKYIEKEQFKELAKRYATNIANARFLWRNRVGVESLEVVVKVLNKDLVLNKNLESSWIFDAAKISLRDFDSNDEKINSLSEKISQALSGQIPFLMLDISAYAQVGKGQEVYPSEELVLNKGNSKSSKSKILYHIDGIAGMHSQKLGNAIRSIDTWYPDYANVTTGPIAIEPYGAVTNLGTAYRNPKNKSDFYTLFDKFARGESLSSENDKHYVMAVLVRGGVFGESNKE